MLYCFVLFVTHSTGKTILRGRTRNIGIGIDIFWKLTRFFNLSRKYAEETLCGNHYPPYLSASNVCYGTTRGVDVNKRTVTTSFYSLL